MLQSDYFCESRQALVLIRYIQLQVDGGLGSGLICSDSFCSLWAPDMAPSPFPIQPVSLASHRALPPIPPPKIPNGRFQPQSLIQRQPPFLVSIPSSIPAVPHLPPKPNFPFNFPHKNPDYFPQYSCQEEIYVCSSSVIELDCSYSTNNDGSDSGIYNASTTTGSNGKNQ